jgi:hypothetical protein
MSKNEAIEAALAKLIAMLDRYEDSIYKTREYCVKRNQPFDDNKLLQVELQRFLCAYDIATDIFGYNTDKYDWVFRATGYAKPVNSPAEADPPIAAQTPQKATPSCALKAAMDNNPTTADSRQQGYSIHR